MKSPQISVMLCAYNASKYIHEAIESILCQTYTDFEFIIVNDGSTDKTLQMIKRYDDKRIRTISRRHNYIESLNTGMKACRGKYIARMDADDKAIPDRLERQFVIMEEQPDIAACFSWGETFGLVDEPVGYSVKGHVKSPFFLFATGNYLIHPTSMIRKSFIQKHRIYYKNDYPYAEDYKLWTEITKKGGEIYVIPEQLIRYRINQSQVSVKFNKEQHVSTLKIQQEVIEELLNRLNHPQRKNIISLFNKLLMLNQAELIQGDEVISFIYRILKNTNFFV